MRKALSEIIRGTIIIRVLIHLSRSNDYASRCVFIEQRFGHRILLSFATSPFANFKQFLSQVQRRREFQTIRNQGIECVESPCFESREPSSGTFLRRKEALARTDDHPVRELVKTRKLREQERERETAINPGHPVPRAQVCVAARCRCAGGVLCRDGVVVASNRAERLRAGELPPAGSS